MGDDFSGKVQKMRLLVIVLFVLFAAVAVLIINNYAAITAFFSGSASVENAETDKMDIFEKIGAWFSAKPKRIGLFLFSVGGFLLSSAVFNWDWVFKGYSYNLQKIEGIANFWGRGAARLYYGIGGVVVIVGSIIWLALG